MNEEEKNAVERIEDTFYSDLGKGINKFQKITLYEDGIRDVRRLLNLLEKLQKENELAKKQVEYDKTYIFTPQTIKLNYIPIQKVKDKIEELKKKVEELTDDKGYWGGSDLLEQIKVLQELLEENENHIPRIN